MEFRPQYCIQRLTCRAICCLLFYWHIFFWRYSSSHLKGIIRERVSCSMRIHTWKGIPLEVLVRALERDTKYPGADCHLQIILRSVVCERKPNDFSLGLNYRQRRPTSSRRCRRECRCRCRGMRPSANTCADAVT